jgi:glutamate-ammonia-ligase adenylyltransferase
MAAAVADLLAGPEPDATAARLARVLAAAPAIAGASRDDPDLAARLVAVCGAGRALAGVVIGLGNAALEPLRMQTPPEGELALESADPVAALRAAVARRLLAIAGLDLTRRIPMPAVGAALSDLADAAARAALAYATAGTGATLAVIALGKWGGRELNYASDIDLVFVHSGDTAAANGAAARFIGILSERTDGGIAFRVDADLRPEGAAGPLSRTVGSYAAYWRQWAQTWEFQAMLKARFAAGDAGLATEFLDTARPFVHPHSLGGDAIREIRAMKLRTERLAAGPDELKRGVGGIRDVEFAVQLLQLVHGRADAELRSANTLEALERLGEGGYVRPEDATALATAYQWLRDVEHRIQLQDLRQTHRVPGDPEGRVRLAKSLGYRDRPEMAASEQFEADLVRYRAEVRQIHERLFYRPLLEAFATATPALVDRGLVALGFTDSSAARAAVADLTAGLSRRSRLMQQLLPLMMEWLSSSPDPDLGLAQLRLLVSGTTDNAALIGALRDNPAAAERLCRVLGTARTAARLLDRLPAMLPTLGDDAALATEPARADLVAAAVARRGTRGDHMSRTMALHRFWSERLVTTVTADIAGLIDVVAVGHRLADAADALVTGLLESAITEIASRAQPVPPLAVMALGKWGGRELNYASDLDGLIVFDGSSPDQAAGAARVAELLVESLAGSPLGLPPPVLDLDLRPEGKKGVIARSLPSYREYWERWALTWEHQSLLRCRPAAGDAALGVEFVAAAQVHAHPERLGDGQLRAIRAMKARVETERIPLGEDPDFHVKLGRGALADVEWTVQLLQMEHGRTALRLRTPSTLQALAALHEAELVDAEDAGVLDAAYRFCAMVRNRLYLRAGRTRNSLPTDPIEAAAVARSLGYDLAPRTALREEYRRLTRRSRRVVERLFYGG